MHTAACRRPVILAACLLVLTTLIRPVAAQSLEETCKQQPHRSCVALIAFDTLGKLTHPIHQSGVISYLAPALAKLGQTRHAMELAAAAPVPAYRAVAVARIAEVMNDEALFDQADIIFRSLPSEEQKALAKQGMAEALARSGRIDRAVAIADTMPRNGIRIRTFSVIAAHDRSDRYLTSVLEQIRAELPSNKASRLAVIAGVRNDAALAAEAIKTARDIPVRGDSAYALAQVAYNLNDPALMTEAMGLSTFIPMGTQVAIAELQGSLGDLRPALNTILPVDDLNIRAYVLSAMAFNLR